MVGKSLRLGSVFVIGGVVCLALGLVVLAGASVGTETAAPAVSPVGTGEALQLAPVTTATATATTVAPQPPGERRAFGSGGTVTLYLERTDPNG